jgi:hypothetical protein
MKFGELRKLMEIAPGHWDQFEIRICWGMSPTQPTTPIVMDDQLKIRFDNNTVDHDSQTCGVAPNARYCFVLFAENPNFDHVKVPS